MCNDNSVQPKSVVSTWDTVGDDTNDSATSGEAVQLEAGDSMFVELYANRARL